MTRHVPLIAMVAFVGIAAPSTAASVSPEQQNLSPGYVARPLSSAPRVQMWTPPEATDAVFDFPSDDSTVVGSLGFINAEEVGYFWSVSRGDLVSETFADAPSITSYRLDVDVVSNALNGGAFVNWNVLINDVLVDNFTVDEGFFGTVSRAATFPSIDGPNYTVEMRVTNEVPIGQGSHSFRYAGVGFHQVELAAECVASIALERAKLRAGEALRATVALIHNRPRTVTAPVLLWVEDSRGRVVAQQASRPLTFQPGDHLRQALEVRLPSGLAAGTYRVLIGVERMQQGLARAEATFEIVE